MQEQLEPADEGLYTLKEGERLPCAPWPGAAPRFVLSGEISTIYKQDGKTRKVHHVILLPGLEEAEALSRRLEAIGNLHSRRPPHPGAGQPRRCWKSRWIAAPEAIFIPAHIWTPHFSLFGAFSDFDTLEECYGDLTPDIHALETGLSSDPPMNRRLSALDGYHAGLQFGRAFSRQAGAGGQSAGLRAFLSGAQARPGNRGRGLRGTVEFYPEEGKYHLDGHRACQCRLEPAETLRLGGLCPVCGKKVTVGVLHRVEQLADRPAPIPLPKPFESLMPLPEVDRRRRWAFPLPAKKVQAAYLELLQRLGPEFEILRELRSRCAWNGRAGPLLGEALRRLRAGKALRQAGYDGEYGVVRLFAPGSGNASWGRPAIYRGCRFPLAGQALRKRPPPIALAQEKETPAAQAETLNPEQLSAVRSDAPHGGGIRRAGHGQNQNPRGPHRLFDRRKGRGRRRNYRRHLHPPGRGRNGGPAGSAAGEKSGRRPAYRNLPCPESEAGGAKALRISRKGPGADRPAADGPAGALSGPGTRWKKSRRKKTAWRVPELPQGLREEYDGTLAAQGLRDLEDVLLEALALPADKKQFHYLLVDEYQDLNAVQRALTEHWSRGPQPVCHRRPRSIHLRLPGGGRGLLCGAAGGAARNGMHSPAPQLPLRARHH